MVCLWNHTFELIDKRAEFSNFNADWIGKLEGFVTSGNTVAEDKIKWTHRTIIVKWEVLIDKSQSYQGFIYMELFTLFKGPKRSYVLFVVGVELS